MLDINLILQYSSSYTCNDVACACSRLDIGIAVGLLGGCPGTLSNKKWRPLRMPELAPLSYKIRESEKVGASFSK
jgi:hypothetical protein